MRGLGPFTSLPTRLRLEAFPRGYGDAVGNLSDFTMTDPDGVPVRFGDLVDRVTVIDLVRYYGCAPCRAFLGEMVDRGDEIAAMGARRVGIGPHAAYQARSLKKHGIDFPLLLDPDHHVSKAIEIPRQSLLRFVFDVRGWWRWLRALGSARQGAITGGWWELPAVIIVDEHCDVVWVHRGRFIGDYPRLDQVLEVVRGVPEA